MNTHHNHKRLGTWLETQAQRFEYWLGLGLKDLWPSLPYTNNSMWVSYSFSLQVDPVPLSVFEQSHQITRKSFFFSFPSVYNSKWRKSNHQQGEAIISREWHNWNVPKCEIDEEQYRFVSSESTLSVIDPWSMPTFWMSLSNFWLVVNSTAFYIFTLRGVIIIFN